MALAEQTVELYRPTLGAAERRSPARGVVRALQVARGSVPGWEWGLGVVALFLLGRAPLLFYRRRAVEIFGGRMFHIWRDDGVIRGVTVVLLLAVFVVAARRCDPRSLLRHPYLLLLLGICLVSPAWSVEPTVSLWRSGLFLGTAVMGWYIGERYTIREQIGLVGAAAAVGAAASVVALLVWPGITQGISSQSGVWSGAYHSRNWLGQIMSMGLLTAPFLFVGASRRRRIPLVAIAALEAFLLFKSGSRTGVVALASSAFVALSLWGVRKMGRGMLKPHAGALVLTLIVGNAGLAVQRNWSTLVRLLDRGTDLTGRTEIWEITRAVSAQRPWTGWGFEAVWAHPATMAQASAAFGSFPHAAHSGYYEILLGVGLLGLVALLMFLGHSVWRVFRFAWQRTDLESLWPFVLFVFAIVMNFSESLFISAESIWALTVAAAVTTVRRAELPQWSFEDRVRRSGRAQRGRDGPEQDKWRRPPAR